MSLIVSALATLVAALATPATGAESEPDNLSTCDGWMGNLIVAVVCDDERARGRVRFPGNSEPSKIDEDVGVAQVLSDEPLLPGEHMQVRLTQRGGGTRLVISVAASVGRERVVSVPLRATGVTDVSVGDDLAVRAVDALGARTFPVPEQPPPAPIPTDLDGVSLAVAGAITTALDGEGVLQLCRLVDSKLRDAFGGVPFGVDDHPELGACPPIMWQLFRGGDNVAKPTASRARWTGTVWLSPNEVVARFAVKHRYEPYATGDPRRVSTTASALLRRDANGVWQLTTPLALFPLMAMERDPRRWTVDGLRRERRLTIEQWRSSRKHTEKVRVATAQLTPQQACDRAPGQNASDPAGDQKPTRPARLNAPPGGDLTEVVVSFTADRRLCILATFADVPVIPLEFGLEVQDAKSRRYTLAAVVRSSTAVAWREEGTMDSLVRVPLAGLEAGLAGERTLVLRLPAAALPRLAPPPKRWKLVSNAQHPFAWRSFSDAAKGMVHTG